MPQGQVTRPVFDVDTRNHHSSLHRHSPKREFPFRSFSDLKAEAVDVILGLSMGGTTESA